MCAPLTVIKVSGLAQLCISHNCGLLHKQLVSISKLTPKMIIPKMIRAGVSVEHLITVYLERLPSAIHWSWYQRPASCTDSQLTSCIKCRNLIGWPLLSQSNSEESASSTCSTQHNPALGAHFGTEEERKSMYNWRRRTYKRHHSSARYVEPFAKIYATPSFRNARDAATMCITYQTQPSQYISHTL